MAVGFGGENIILNSTEPNFVRDVISTYNDLVSTDKNYENNYDIGHIVYCTEKGEHYVFRGPNYEGSEETHGHWTKLIKKQDPLNVATSTNLGGIKIGFEETGKKYAVKLENGKAYVEVPWTDTIYTLQAANANSLGGVKVEGNKGVVMKGTNNEVLEVDFDDTKYSEVEDITTHEFSTTTVASPDIVNKIVTAKLNEAIYGVLETPL